MAFSGTQTVLAASDCVLPGSGAALGLPPPTGAVPADRLWAPFLHPNCNRKTKQHFLNLIVSIGFDTTCIFVICGRLNDLGAEGYFADA